MTYYTEDIAAATGLTPGGVRMVARVHGRGERKSIGWTFTEADLQWFLHDRPPKGWTRGRPRGPRRQS